jgi:plastocyanin
MKILTLFSGRAPRATTLIPLRAHALVALLLSVISCTKPAKRAVAAYVPVTRELTVTTVPLLVKEQVNLYPFLKAARAKGGVLEGHEVYAFSPSSLTVVEGDTIHFTLINPEDDVHSFVLPDLGVSLPGNTIVKKTYVAKRPGIFTILCAVQEHLPMMSGQLVVLPAATMAGVGASTARGR